LSQSAKGLSYTGSFPLVTAPAVYVERRRLFALSINMENAPPFVAGERRFDGILRLSCGTFVTFANVRKVIVSWRGYLPGRKKTLPIETVLCMFSDVQLFESLFSIVESPAPLVSQRLIRVDVGAALTWDGHGSGVTLV
jgi:hypothetical protein